MLEDYIIDQLNSDELREYIKRVNNIRLKEWKNGSRMTRMYRMSMEIIEALNEDMTEQFEFYQAMESLEDFKKRMRKKYPNEGYCVEGNENMKDNTGGYPVDGRH